MPTITLNRKVFEKLVGKKLPLNQLRDRISYLGTDLESIEGNEIVVEVFPNRPDMLSEQGFARALSSFIGVKKGLQKYTARKSGQKVIIDKSVKDVRPYTCCAIVKNIKFDSEKIKEIVQIQEKLHITYGRNRRKAAIGIYPMEKITFPVRFMARKPEDIKFRPLEYDKVLNAKEILYKHPAGREYGHLLEGMGKFPFFIDANKQILSVPPIINSHETGKITERTKEVFIECSGFDFDTLSKCLNIIVTALADMGGQIYSVNLAYPNKRYVTPDLRPGQIKIDLSYVNTLLGLDLKKKDIKELLAKMGHSYTGNTVQVAPYRTDILHQMDIVEDIAIAYGYENFEPHIPNVATVGEEDMFESFKTKVSRLLTGFNLLETSTYHIINKDDMTRNMNTNIKCIELENPLNAEFNVLRSWMIPSLIRVLSQNKHYEYPQNLFEIGKVFTHDEKQETKVKEITRLAVVLSHADVTYTDARQVLDALLRSLGLDYEVAGVGHKSFIDGRSGRVIVNGKKVAYIGEISPIVLENFELKMPVSCFELNLSEIFDILTEHLS